MARSGMDNLISRWRRMVDDAGTAVWSDDQAQELLDDNRVTVYAESLTAIAQDTGTTVTYTVYHSRYGNQEELASGITVWRLFDASGSTIGTASYTVDYQRGIVTFGADQHGSARYLDARSYDLAGAAADAWRQRAGMQADGYDFSADGASYNRSQWFKHCQEMAAVYDRQRVMSVSLMSRSDLNG